MDACRPVAAAALLLLCLAAGCADNAVPGRIPTGATCPPDNDLTYENFGQPFMETYCTRCHASYLHGADRQGAPLYHDFDTLLGILVVADHVDEYAAAGPDAVNTMMPPNGAKPTLEEREDLGKWLACELDNLANPPDGGVDGGMAADAGPSDASPGDGSP